MRSAGLMLILKDGKILSISRRNDPSKFGLLGGKVEEGETPKEAAIREAIEESGVVVTNCELIYVREELGGSPDGEDFLSFCYFTLAEDCYMPGIFTTEEGLEVRWLTPEELVGEMGAFAEYNRKTLEILKILNPELL